MSHTVQEVPVFREGMARCAESGEKDNFSPNKVVPFPSLIMACFVQQFTSQMVTSPVSVTEIASFLSDAVEKALSRPRCSCFLMHEADLTSQMRIDPSVDVTINQSGLIYAQNITGTG